MRALNPQTAASSLGERLGLGEVGEAEIYECLQGCRELFDLDVAQSDHDLAHPVVAASDTDVPRSFEVLSRGTFLIGVQRVGAHHPLKIQDGGAAGLGQLDHGLVDFRIRTRSAASRTRWSGPCWCATPAKWRSKSDRPAPTAAPEYSDDAAAPPLFRAPWRAP